jgi:hypothetical protein
MPDDVRLDKGFTRKAMTMKVVAGLLSLGREALKDVEPEIAWLVRVEGVDTREGHLNSPHEVRCRSWTVSVDFPGSCGEPCRARTCDLLIKSQLLYQLS